MTTSNTSYPFDHLKFDEQSISTIDLDEKYFSQTYSEAAHKFESFSKSLVAAANSNISGKNSTRWAFYDHAKISSEELSQPNNADEECKMQFCVISLDTRSRNDDDNNDEPTMEEMVNDSTKVLVISSGTHGVEGYAGSAIQLYIMDKILKSDAKVPDNGRVETFLPSSMNTLIVLVHAINPVGMKYNRRWNENNIDLNRNALTNEQLQKLEKTDILQSTYEKFEDFINPKSAPGWFYRNIGIWFSLIGYVMRYGMVSLKQTLVAATYKSSKGLFYGGNKLQPSHVELKKFFKQHFAKSVQSKNVFWCDIHTGLGQCGIDTILGNVKSEEDHTFMKHAFPHKPGFCAGYMNSISDKEDVLRFRCGEQVQVKGEQHTSNTLLPDEKNIGQGYEFTVGILGSADWISTFFKPNTGDPYVITQEFGTVPSLVVAKALMFENAGWFYDTKENHDKLWSQYTRDAFYLSRNEWWKRRIIERGVDVLGKMLLVTSGKKE